MLIFNFTADRPEKMKLAIFFWLSTIRETQGPCSGTAIVLSVTLLSGKFLVNAAKAAGPPENIINHSVRKTCISRLMDADDLPENNAAQLSGQKSLKNLHAYKSASQSHQRRISMALSRSNVTDSAGNSEIQAAKASEFEVSVQRQEASSLKTEGLLLGATIGKCEGSTLNLNTTTTASNVFRRCRHLAAG